MTTHTQRRRHHGFTLIEMMVAMLVLTVLGASMAAVMVSQMRSATSIQSMTMVQSDVNLALSMMRADIAQAGYGNATADTATFSQAAASGADSLVMAGTNLGAGAGRWTTVTATNSASPTTLNVYLWSGADTVYNIQNGDSIKILSGVKQLIGCARVSSGGKTATLTLNKSVGTAKGSLVTQVNEAIGTAGKVIYSLNTATRQLLRNGQPFLDNVEDFQVRYFWDKDGNGTIDSTAGEFDDALSVVVNPATWNYRPILVGVAVVTVSPTQEAAIVDGRTSYTIWTHTTNLSTAQQRHYRNFYSLYIRPRDIGG
ncbi:MAG TPA: prepilin-type N-terminal cleavage/methylation domain-containing protein [Candidatus Edwardsbacteria bacterium]|nr:prepilin-type N-terminal cleavage/methylation domain-containing protein [Candidatus Edwardsbacteria bacterium]